MNSRDDINRWPMALDQLHIPEPSADFAARIIAEATPQPAKPAWGLRTFFAELLLPKPALAFAFMLSIIVGWQASSLTVFGDISANLGTTTSSVDNAVLDSFHFNAGQVL